ncbi:MAG TPA: SCO family protein [Ottowia sp.]|jgi:protein SCO1/2|nr:MAG: electron transporter SenC [Burkholderiales bacterium 68-10]HMT17118.1 SCO family protein [Ottowia sp.]HMT57851.1 SCO family protein [Ottowia sp.]HMT64117.1 SCO family protein [Ottowia sp.]HMT83667.1 SCO family protein [Ottowia sp.]
MWRTALLSLLLLLGGWGVGSWLTHDFQVWTDEGARRLEVALRPVPAPPVQVDGPDVTAATLPGLLAGGGVTIADFIYTDCRSTCLSLGSSFQQLQAALQADRAAGAPAAARLLSISFDGARDDPVALRDYARRLNADPALWRFVRVPRAAQQQALLDRLGVVVVPDGRGDYEHNAALLVFDTQGRMVRVFDIEERQLALDYARHLARQQAPGTAS